jgi:3-hydroxyacyl-CoA dehydrogenase/enoyl-CoA hydratase/3-hydroxybutyryl-CoA epimerase
MSLSLRTLKLEIDALGIAVITIDVPGRSMNVLTPELIADLATAIEHLAAAPDIKGAIITSGKDNAFAAGADLTELVDAYAPGVTPASAMTVSRKLSALFRRLETCGKPIAAAINGLALGGGLELCLACHHRVLSDDPKAVVGFPEVTVGLLPGAGGTQRLPRLVGIAAALPLLLDGRHVLPAQSKTLGIVHALAPKTELVDLARRWLLDQPTAEQPWDAKGFRVPGGVGPLAPHALQSFVVGAALITGGGGRNYPAPLAILSCVYEGTQVALDVGLRIESKYFGKLLADPVARNLMRTMFVNKGAADKLAARPKAPPKSRVTKLGVIGAGLMGAGIAHVSAKAGINVVLLDSILAKAEKGKAGIAALQSKDLAKGRTTQDKIDALLNRIVVTEDFKELAGVDLIVEAVFEDRGVKEDVIRRAEAVIAGSTVFATNTSTLPISGLAATAKRPNNVIGLHFFSPVEKMPLVEVIAGVDTSETAIARALDYVGQLRKTPIVVRDSPGFFTSRVFSTFVHEGLKMLDDGVAPALIENAAKLAGFPIGPLAVSDEVTLSLQQSILKQQELDGIPERLRIRAGSAVLDRMVDELKRPGRRQGGGFYDYPPAGPKKLWTGLVKAFPPAARQPEARELQLRFLTIMALESARCFEDGIVSTPSDADIASVLGIGYPSWTGGTLSYIDTVRIQTFAHDCQMLAERLGERFAASDWLIERARAGTPFYSKNAVPAPKSAKA